MIYLTGDTHGDFRRVAAFCDKADTTKDDVLVVKCGSCGKSLVRSCHSYLQCNGYSKGQCKTSSFIKYEVLEGLVLEELKKAFTAPLELNIVPRASDRENKEEFELLEQQISTFAEKFLRIKTAFRDGIDSLEEYKENKTFLESERRKQITKLENLKETLLTADEEQPIERRLEDVYELLTDDCIDLETKYQAAHFLINKITYQKEEKTLKLTCKY